jgi:hypothetical protein
MPTTSSNFTRALTWDDDFILMRHKMWQRICAKKDSSHGRQRRRAPLQMENASHGSRCRKIPSSQSNPTASELCTAHSFRMSTLVLMCLMLCFSSAVDPDIDPEDYK